MDNADFSTKYQKGENFALGKTLLLPMELLKTLNPSCIDLGYADDKPCMLHIGVWCMDK